MPKLDLLIAKFDYYVVNHPRSGLFSFSVDHEGIFLFLKPLQLALLWPWVKF